MSDKILKFLAISNSGGGSSSQPNIQELNITQNGTYEASGDVDGYNPVVVNVTNGEPEPPDDGKTRLYITVPANSMPGLPPPRNEVPLYISQTVANGVTIDWGDGTEPETLPGTGNVNTTHTYQQAGDYVISLDPSEGCALGFGDGAEHCVLGHLAESGDVYTSMLRRVIIGNRGVNTVGDFAFIKCASLRAVEIPNGVTLIGTGAFHGCYSLLSMHMPDSVTDIGPSAFSECASLSNLKISNNISGINEFTFFQCYSLSSITIPNNVDLIGTDSFSGLYGIKEYHMLPKTPPAMYNVEDIFVPSDCIIYVPVGSLEAYQTAENWSTYAGQMQEEPT